MTEQGEQRRRGGTRERIQEIAVHLFAERGYDNTSLREIAEELGVTKAALYYHFKTKEDLVNSLIGDMAGKVDAIIAWAEQQSDGPETRRECIRRFHAMLYGSNDAFARDLQRFMQTNQQLFQERIKMGGEMRARFMRLAAMMMPPAAPPAARLKGRMAMFALFAARGMLDAEDTAPDEIGDAALDVALDLISALDPY